MIRRPQSWIAPVLLAALLLSGCQIAPLLPLTTLLLEAIEEQTEGAVQPLILPSARVGDPSQSGDEALPDVTQAKAEWEAFVVADRDLVFYHPATWTVFNPGADDLAAIFSAVEGQVSAADLQRLLDSFFSSPEMMETLFALGFLFDDTFGAHPEYVNNLNLMELPAEGLTLNLYARLVGGQLENLSYVDVQEVGVVDGLRPYGEEVASLRYTMSGGLQGLDEPLEGWQVAVLSDGGDRLLVVTFTTLASDFGALEPALMEIIERIEY